LDNTIPKRIGYLEIKLRQFAAFLVTFFAVEKSDWHVGPPPTVLIESEKKPSKKITIGLPKGLPKGLTPTLLTLKLKKKHLPLPDDINLDLKKKQKKGPKRFTVRALQAPHQKKHLTKKLTNQNFYPYQQQFAYVTHST
jgi:hypothetical protein